jgi:hypothetical protein
VTAVRSRAKHRRTRAIGVFSLALVLAASSPHEAAAGGPTQLAFTDGAGRSGSVLVAVAATDAEALALFDALRELLARLHLRLRPVRREASGAPNGALIEPGMAAGEDRACVAVDARSADRVLIEAYGVRDGGLARPVERTVLRTDSSAIVVEQVAHVVYATLESLLAPTEPRPEQEPDAPTAASAPKDPVAALPADRAQGPQMPRARFGLDAEAFASLREVASGVGPSTGGGAAMGLGLLRLPLQPSIWLAASFDAPFDVPSQETTLETSVESFRAIPAAQLFTLGILRVDFGAGAGMDLFHTTPRNASRSSIKLSPAMTLADPVIAAQLVTRTNVARVACLLVGVSVDYDLGVHDYTALDRFGNTNSVLVPWRFRPSAIMGLWIPLAGTTVCSNSE